MSEIKYPHTPREIVPIMLKKRGYTEINQTDDDNDIYCVDNFGHKTYICLETVQKLDIATIQRYVFFLQENEISHGIVIYNGNPTSAVKKFLENSEAIGLHIEIFPEIDLQIDITTHKLVPQHIKLSSEEAKEFKLKYGIKIPEMLRNKPVSRFYDYRHGDIIKIIRQNGVVAYRLVK
jgi:DNA-directed RNA polymerase I, II, and III subunit RPABC1